MAKVRIPQQQRSLETKKRIEDAAFELFSLKGIHGTNSREIADKAGVAIGSFYSYYKDKKQLLLDILENFLNMGYTMIWQDLRTMNLGEITLADIRSLLVNVFKAFDIAPTFLSQTHALRYSDPEINKIFERGRQRELDQIMKLFKTNENSLSLRDPYAAAIIFHNAVEQVAHTSKFIGTEIEESRLIDELAHIIHDFFVFNTRGNQG
ncbi:MAG: TetR/AcrR family transcriptional regulator [Desulfobacteraceae bacterium]|jgi:AcrR family transcriptional regulator